MVLRWRASRAWAPLIFYRSFLFIEVFYREEGRLTMPSLHDTGEPILPYRARFHPGSLLFLCIRLHDTTRKCHIVIFEFAPVVAPKQEFHSGTKSRTIVLWTKKVLVWTWLLGGLGRVVHAWISTINVKCAFMQTYEIDVVGTELESGRLFSSKRPLLTPELR